MEKEKRRGVQAGAASQELAAAEVKVKTKALELNEYEMKMKWQQMRCWEPH